MVRYGLVGAEAGVAGVAGVAGLAIVDFDAFVDFAVAGFAAVVDFDAALWLRLWCFFVVLLGVLVVSETLDLAAGAWVAVWADAAPAMATRPIEARMAAARRIIIGCVSGRGAVYQALLGGARSSVEANARGVHEG
jgi:hypothetical protein